MRLNSVYIDSAETGSYHRVPVLFILDMLWSSQGKMTISYAIKHLAMHPMHIDIPTCISSTICFLERIHLHLKKAHLLFRLLQFRSLQFTDQRSRFHASIHAHTLTCTHTCMHTHMCTKVHLEKSEAMVPFCF